MSGWRRVSRAHPCPVCGRPDWCLLSRDGAAVICPRVESVKRCGEAGWLHRLAAAPWRPDRRLGRRVPLTAGGGVDLARLAAEHQRAVDPGRLQQLAAGLGLTTDSLVSLGVGWSAGHRAWAFPMRDAGGGVLGIRLRRPDGRKFAVRGGREGLFLPQGGGGGGTGGRLLVCEGPTDAAALLDLGFDPGAVAGRPSCTGGTKLLCELVRQRRPSEVTVIADGDEPGRRGAANLAAVLLAYAPAVRVVQPPSGVKDVRDWLRAGGTRRDVEQQMAAAPARRLAIRAVLETGQRG